MVQVLRIYGAWVSTRIPAIDRVIVATSHGVAALLRREIPHDMSNIQGKPGDYLYEASVKGQWRYCYCVFCSFNNTSSPATENSWKQRFAGRAHVALKSHIMHYQTSITNCYAPHCAIVQSTGTGKSKTVDEFSKHDFVIPINLRKPRAGGAHAQHCPLAMAH